MAINREIMRKKWSKIARLRASERYYKVIEEQGNLLLDILNSGEIDPMSMLDDLGSYVDSSIFGNRLNSPPFYNGLVRFLKNNTWLKQVA
jgi:hypothetical protein